MKQLQDVVYGMLDGAYNLVTKHKAPLGMSLGVMATPLAAENQMGASVLVDKGRSKGVMFSAYPINGLEGRMALCMMDYSLNTETRQDATPEDVALIEAVKGDRLGLKVEAGYDLVREVLGGGSIVLNTGVYGDILLDRPDLSVVSDRSGVNSDKDLGFVIEARYDVPIGKTGIDLNLVLRLSASMADASASLGSRIGAERPITTR